MIMIKHLFLVGPSIFCFQCSFTLKLSFLLPIKKKTNLKVIMKREEITLQPLVWQWIL